MKIACIGYLHGAGGAEKQIIMLANALAERGHEIHLIILAVNNSQYDIRNDIIKHDLSSLEKKNGNKILNRYFALKELLKEIVPDISINYWLQSAYLCSMMSKSITGKIIYSERGDPGDKEYSGILGIVRWLAFKRINGFVFQSEGARNYFSEKIQKKSIVIHNSVSILDDKYMIPCKQRKKKIITVGRLHPQKNQKILIDAFSKIANDLPEFELDIYGDGELKSELQEQICKLGMGNRIYLRGTVKNILDYVYESSIFVLSSDYEGLPNALMEALAMGVPCISTDCKPGGAKTLIKDGLNGWIVPRGNVDMLAKKIKEVLNTEIDNCLLQREAINFRLTHSSKTVFNKWEEYINLLYKNKQ